MRARTVLRQPFDSSRPQITIGTAASRTTFSISRRSASTTTQGVPARTLSRLLRSSPLPLARMTSSADTLTRIDFVSTSSGAACRSEDEVFGRPPCSSSPVTLNITYFLRMAHTLLLVYLIHSKRYASFHRRNCGLPEFECVAYQP